MNHFGDNVNAENEPFRPIVEMNHFGQTLRMNNLRKIRLERRIKAITFAKALGTSEQQLARLEKGLRRMTVDWLNKCVDAFKKLGHSDVRAAMLIGDIDAGLMEESGALVPVQESLPQIPPAEIESLVAMFKLLGKKDRHEILKFVGDKLLRANIGEDDPAENPTKNAKKPTKKAAT